MSTRNNTKRNESTLVRESVESNKGGKEVIFRIVEAYGFSSRQALCNHLGVSQSTLANRSARDAIHFLLIGSLFVMLRLAHR